MSHEERIAWLDSDHAKLVLPFLWERLIEEISRDAEVLGSLIMPERRARDYLAKTYHNDPPEFREAVQERFFLWLAAFLRRLREREPMTEEDLLVRLAAAESLRRSKTEVSDN